MSDLAWILERLNADYRFDARGRIAASRAGGLPPRFVLGRTVEGCVWRMRADLDRALEVALARLAGKERGVRFDGELPAPPERMAALERVLATAASEESEPARAIRSVLTRDGVGVGELWRID